MIEESIKVYKNMVKARTEDCINYQKDIQKLSDELEEQDRHIKEADIEIERLNNIIDELEKWINKEQKRYREYLLERATNDSEYNSQYATQCGLTQLDVVLDKLKELKEGK